MPPKIKSRPLICACIVSYNTRELTLSTLHQLIRSTQGEDLDIYVVDNGSTDGSAEALIEVSRSNDITVLYSSRNLGYGGALNKAFKMSDAPYLLALNSDLQFPDRGWLTCLYRYMAETPDVGCVGPLLVDQEGKIGGAGVVGTVTKRDIRWWRKPLKDYQEKLKEPKDCISICGACMLMRREAFKDCGGFDENYLFYFEETHLHRLMRVFGWRTVFHPRSKVVHLWNKSPKPGKFAQEQFKNGDDYFKRVWGDGVVIPE